jgi:serine/threonine protein kinase
LNDEPVAIKVVAKSDELERSAHALIDATVANTTKLVSTGTLSVCTETYDVYAFTPVGVAYRSADLVHNPSEALQLFQTVLATLKEAHPFVFHRDIKPQNLLRKEVEGKVSIFTNDWGLAIQPHDVQRGDSSGTRRFSSPLVSSPSHCYDVHDDYAGLVLTVADLVKPELIGWRHSDLDIAQQKLELFAGTRLDDLLGDEQWRHLILSLRSHFQGPRSLCLCVSLCLSLSLFSSTQRVSDACFLC